ncbi:MAG: hypothetical protein E6H05_07685 [Bacillati bacterium ANGP1]|uniref:Blue (type 1) copper domain-containing protein n=1 Tax=Candidatus Segetimicrobium genomatis TaxID=2569760 RepID=A0A537IVH2_9BACT|nr:MAG: hypothetical protein E6H05_07685 [Terrabacteria group bacterium ANGP1]
MRAASAVALSHSPGTEVVTCGTQHGSWQLRSCRWQPAAARPLLTGAAGAASSAARSVRSRWETSSSAVPATEARTPPWTRSWRARAYTWTWNAAGSHSIQSTGVPPEIFRNSVVLVGANYTYSVTFRTPGTYPYDCAVHGSAMTGRIVVQ